MSYLKKDLIKLKYELTELLKLIQSLLQKTRDALITLDKDLTREVIATEMRVNALVIKIDRDCEDIFVHFNPVDVDLRFVISILKINGNLKRIGEITQGLARYIVKIDLRLNERLLEITNIVQMNEHEIDNLYNVWRAFEYNDTRFLRGIFNKEATREGINAEVTDVIMHYIQDNPDNIEPALNMLSAVKMLERLSEQCKNIAVDFIFDFEGKSLIAYVTPLV